MKRLMIFLLIGIVLVVSFGGSVFGFIEPPYIPVAKPTPINTVTVCSSGCNYATLEQADQAAGPGWLIRVKAGTYGCTDWDSNGQAGNEIVIEAYGNGNVIFACSGNLGFDISGSYIIFDGGINKELIFDGSGLTENDFVLRPDDTGSDYVTLSRIVVRNGFSDSTNLQPTGDYFKLLNSEVYGSESVGIYGRDGDYHEIRNNIIHDNLGSGIQYNPHEVSYSVDELIIAGNLIYNNGIGGPVGIRPGITLLSSTNELYDVYVSNNLIFGNKEMGIKVTGDSNLNASIYQNTVYNNVDNGVWFEDNDNHRIKNNIVYGNGGLNWNTYSGGLAPTDPECENNIYNEDPQFVSTNPSSPDYLKISLSSPARDTGTDLSGVVNIDYFGTSRPQPLGGAYDIGAHEYISGTPTPCSLADADSSGSVSITELINYISQWKAGNVVIGDLITAIGEWKNGC